MAVLESFNEQFAENQRAREALFAKIVGYIGFIVVGYGYTQQIEDVSITTLTYAAVASSILLSLGACFVASMAY